MSCEISRYTSVFPDQKMTGTFLHAVVKRPRISDDKGRTDTFSDSGVVELSRQSDTRLR